MLNGPRSRVLVEGFRASLILLCIPAIPLAFAYAIGTTLPEDHTATATAIIQASPPRVWELITDFSAQQNWRKGPLLLVRGPKRQNPDEPCWLEGWLLLKMTLCTTDSQPNRSRTVETIETADTPLPFDATWTYDLSPAGSSSTTTSLSITQHTTIDPPIWRFIGRYILRRKTGAHQYLQDLQAEALHHP